MRRGKTSEMFHCIVKIARAEFRISQLEHCVAVFRVQTNRLAQRQDSLLRLVQLLVSETKQQPCGNGLRVDMNYPLRLRDAPEDVHLSRELGRDSSASLVIWKSL